jgi:hypothetical protein
MTLKHRKYEFNEKKSNQLLSRLTFAPIMI